MQRQTERVNVSYHNTLEWFKKVEEFLAQELRITKVMAGKQIIRGENGWPENEKLIEYAWIIEVSRSLVGWGYLFVIKFNENEFRGRVNPEELLMGIFTCDHDGINQICFETTADITDNVASTFTPNLFQKNNGWNGLSYNVRIIASNINSFMQINNCLSLELKEWEEEVLALGSHLAQQYAMEKMVELFKWRS